jgi:hypothetical protein
LVVMYEWNAGRASTLSVGFDGVLDFAGSAQTGYTTTAAVGFRYLQAGQLCGTAAKPGNTGPGVLVAS